jgi:SNF family Na+-dependent transporter
VEYDPSTEMGSIFQDAYSQVFFSLGCCVGIWYSYGSYNKIKKPVIMDACIIAAMDFLFAFLAGFITWGVIGWLYKNDNLAYMQNNSIGLALIAFPEATAESGNGGFFGIFCFFLFIAGIDSAFCYVESIVTNIVDEFKTNRIVTAAIVCVSGIALSALFTSNWGWVLFDLVEHYISSYIIMGVGLLQCISVGWLFEYETTAMKSEAHRKSMKLLTSIYWLSTITWCFYANFGFVDNKDIGFFLIIVFTFVALGISKHTSGMPFDSWYHEIVLCGVDKLSMSITSLSIPGKPE